MSGTESLSASAASGPEPMQTDPNKTPKPARARRNSKNPDVDLTKTPASASQGTGGKRQRGGSLGGIDGATLAASIASLGKKIKPQDSDTGSASDPDLDISSKIDKLATSMLNLTAESAASKALLKEIHDKVSGLTRRVEETEKAAKKALKEALANSKEITSVKSEQSELSDRLDAVEAAHGTTESRLDKLERTAYSQNKYIFERTKTARISDYQFHQATFVLAAPEFDIYADYQTWIDQIASLIQAANQNLSMEQVHSCISSVYVLDKKLYKRAQRSKDPIVLKYSLQLVVHMTNLQAKIDTTDSLAKMFKRRPDQYKDYRVSRFIPPTLQPEYAQIKKILIEASKDKRSSRFSILPVYDSLVGYTLKVQFTPDINTQPLKDFEVHWDKPYPSPDWRPAS